MARHSILIIDEGERESKRLCTILGHTEYETCAVASLDEVTIRFISNWPDLSMLALETIDQGGLSLILSARADDQLSEFPIAVLAGRGSKIDAFSALEIETDNYGTKLFGPRGMVPCFGTMYWRSNSIRRVENSGLTPTMPVSS